MRTIITKQPITWLRYYTHEVSELHPVAHDVNDLNNSSRSSLHLSRINLLEDQLSTGVLTNGKAFAKFKSMIHDDRNNECRVHALFMFMCKEGVVKEQRF